MPNSQTANKLRWMAETADGIRDLPCAMVWNTDGDLTIVEVRKAAGMSRVDVDVVTESNGDGLKHDKPIEIVYDGKNMLLDPETDAIFLTQSAIEKFVLPYYAKMQTLEWIIGKRDELFKNPNIVAALHASPSITTGWPPNRMLIPLARDPGTGVLTIL